MTAKNIKIIAFGLFYFVKWRTCACLFQTVEKHQVKWKLNFQDKNNVWQSSRQSANLLIVKSFLWSHQTAANDEEVEDTWDDGDVNEGRWLWMYTTYDDWNLKQK